MQHTYQKMDKVFWQDFFQLVKPFWLISEDKKKAYLYLAINLICSFAGVYASVALNSTKKNLVDSLSNFDKPHLILASIQFLALAVLVFFCAGYGSYVTGLLSIRWQRWLTEHKLSQWLDHQNHYQMQFLTDKIDNPDQRITEDMASLPELSLKIFFLSLNAISSYVSFSVVLWGLSSVLSFHFLGYVWQIPGYLYFAASFYGLLGLYLVGLIGRKLSAFDYLQQQFNADFRSRLVRIREFSEQIALLRGEGAENQQCRRLFDKIVANFLHINHLRKNLLFFTIGFEILTQIMGLFLAIPLFLARKVQMGGMLQISGAFVSVVSAFSNMIEAYSLIAQWKAVIFRLTEFEHALHAARLPLHQNIVQSLHDVPEIHLNQFKLYHPDGHVLTSCEELKFKLGKKYLITGSAGLGKSSLFRSISGLWPYASGEIHLARDAKIFMLPQRSYLPKASLREVLVYPELKKVSDQTLMKLLEICGLSFLEHSLDLEKNWTQILSLGQQQLLGFIRLFIAQADYIFLDEASSSLDEENEAKMYRLINEYCPGACVISIGHRPSLKPWHDYQLEFQQLATES